MWDTLKGLVRGIIAEEGIFCLLGYIVQFGNYMIKFEEIAM
jgi:hypothetical protein